MVDGEILIDQEFLDQLYLGSSGGTADGEIIAPDFVYSEEVSRNLSLPASSFLVDGNLWRLAADDGHYGFRGNSTFNAPAQLTAPVQLPDGATIRSVHCYVYDNNSSRSLEVSMRLTQSNLTSGASGAAANLFFAEIETSGSNTQLRELGGDGLDIEVDNSQRALQLALQFFTTNGGVHHRFYGCRIGFGVTTPAP